MSTVLALRVDDQTAERVAAIADARGVPRSDIVRDALVQALDELENEAKP